MQRMFRLRFEHFVETLSGHEDEVLRQQLVPVDGDERRTVLEEVRRADFFGDAVERHARANVDGRHKRALAKPCENGEIPRIDNETVIPVNPLITHPSGRSA